MRHPRLALPLAIALLSSFAAISGCTRAVPIETASDAMPADAPPSVLDLWAGVPPLEPLPDDVRMVLEPQPGPDKPKAVSETIEVPFPPEGDPPTLGKVEPVPAELAVERFGPEDEVTLVDAVRLTFNQPMVPLADVESLKAKPIPLEIDPRPPGRVRWLGTRTLVFEPEGRMPFSTRYTVTVPAGVKSTDGKALADRHTWTFSTPKLQLESSSPWTTSTEVELQPTISLAFNQAIERRALVGATTLTGGGKSVELAVVPPRPAMPTDGEEVARLAARSISVVPVTKLEPNTRYTLKIDAGTFGEGPEKSDPITISFSTYPPLRLSKTPCDGTCWATNGISLTSTTTLDDPDVQSKVHVDPAPADLSISASWYGIQISGDFEGKKTYAVTVDPGLTDSHGQTLGTTFKTKVKLGPPYPSLQLSTYGSNPGVIEKAAAPTLDLKIAGLEYVDVQARALGAGEVESFLDAYSSDGDWGWPTLHDPATYDERTPTRASLVKRDELTLDLGKMLTPGKNHVWLIARSNQYKTYGWTERAGVSKLVEITDLGISAALDNDSGVALVTRLSDGSPVSGAKLRLVERGTLSRELWSGTTDASGFAEIGYAGTAGILHAETSDDHAFLRMDQSDLRGQWTRWYGGETDQARAFIFTERTPYKPGETIHLSGIVRKETRGPEGGVEMWRTGVTGNYTVTAPRGIEAAKGTVDIGPFGTFSVDIPTDENGGTGHYQFRLEVAGLLSSDTFYHSIPVEEYRAPEFTVEVGRPESTPLLFGDRLVAEIRGNYLHGAPMVGGEVAYSMTRTDTDFRPPGELNDGFTFGIAPTWARFGRGGYHGGDFGYGGGYGYGYGSQQITSGTGTLDNLGVLTFEHLTQEIEPPPPGTPEPPAPVLGPPKKEDRPPRAATYSIQSTVTDKNRQSIAGSASFVVHPAKVYVGLRSQRSVLKEGEQAELEAVLVDLEGERVKDGAVALQLVRRETTRKAVEKLGRWTFEYETTEVPSGDCALTSALTPTSCTVTVGEPGTYVVRGTAKDEGGHVAKSELTIYVHGKDAVVWEDQERRVDLVPDKKTYKPGDTAKLLVRSPFDQARGLVVVEREGIKHEYRVEIEGGAGVVEIPITETMIPAVTTSALLVRGRTEVPGAPKGQDLGIPAAATGQVDLKVADARKKIDVALEAAPEIAPGETLKLTVRTHASDGTATKAAVAVMVVDEGVLSLMGHQTPDPLTFFHHQRAGQVSLHALHTAVLARDEPPPAGVAPGTEIGESFGVGGLGLRGTGRGGGGNDEGTIGLGTIGTIGHGGGGGTGSGYGRGSAPQAEEESDAAPPAPSAKPSAAPARSARDAREKSGPALDRADSGKAESKKSADLSLLDPSQAMAQEVKLRTVFATTAFFDAEVLTDESGTATIEIPMPENLTTFRIMAVAVDPAAADRFGSGDTSVRVRKPLMVRPSLPRFLNYGDEFEGSVMVDNQTGADQQVLVGTRGLNVALPSEVQKLVRIPAGESREVRFDMKVEAVGTMRLQFAAMSNAGRDATQVSIPVHYPATTEAFADYGVTDTSLARAIEPPGDVLPAFGGLELTFSSTALSGLEDAVEYLVTYEYECAEQTASRILPIFALDEILDDFPIATVADRARRDGLALEGIDKLWKTQLWDGGFGYWTAKESWPYLTNWVTFALLEGKRAGHKVDDVKLGRALDYIENFVRYGHRTRWGVYYDWTSRAFGMWLLSGEKRGEALFDQVWAHRSEMPLYARAQLMAVAHRFGKTAERDEIMAELKKKVVESARTIHFAESSSEADAEGLRVLMHSSVQTDAIVLMALLEVAPTDPMLSKVMAGIMSERDPRQGGRWATTHANAWALLAASRYYHAVEGEVPSFDANVWLDDQFAGTHAFKGRSMAKTHQRVPMTSLLGADQRTLTLHKDGTGKLYYRIGLDYAPAELKMKPEDQGFTVYREYEALPEPGQKEADPEAVKRMDDGSWQVKAGTNVKVTLHIVARDRANYVVIDDAMPAGFEGQNPKFVTSVGAAPTASRTPGHDRWWWGWWWSFDHTEMRDDRMLLFSDHMYAGVYEYSYTARATTIGKFHLPPVKAEAMYEPERFGRSGSSVVHVVK